MRPIDTLPAQTGDYDSNGYGINNDNTNGWINVKTCGAKGDGSTDDGPAIRSCINKIPSGGGVLYFPPNRAGSLTTPAVYYVNSQAGNDGQCGIYFPVSGMRLWAYGTKIKQGPRDANSLVCMYPDTVAAPHGGWESATSYLVGATVNRGDTSLTLSTHANASHFIAGDVVFIQGYDTTLANNAMGVNIVVTANASTGVLTFAWPFLKAYASHLTAYPVIADVQSRLVSDIGIYGATLQMQGDVYGINMGEFHRGTIKDVTIQGASTDNSSVFSGIDLLDLTIDNVRSTQPCASPFSLSSRGETDVKVINSTFGVTNVPACTKTPGAYIEMGIDVGEGVERTKFDHDTVYDATGYGSVVFGPSADTVLTNSSISGINRLKAYALVETGTIDYGAYDARMSHNQITLSGTNNSGGGLAVQLANTDNSDIFDHNQVWSYLDTRQMMQVSAQPATISDNYFYTGVAQTYGYLVASVSNSVAGNHFAGLLNPRCITVSDPGSPSTLSLWLLGNDLSNCTTPILYCGSAQTNIPNRIIQANLGVANYSPNNSKTTGQAMIGGLKTTGAAAGKVMVCVDTSTGQLYASSTDTGCAN
ncbi:MAG: glycosyl hydrolase family 28-related protein [Candidatus Binataceae bacterium]